MLNAEDFGDRIKKALEKPDAADSKKVYALVNKHICMTARGQVIPYGPLARAAACTTLYAYCHFYGLPSVSSRT
jgi:hypothetical protein